MSEKLGEAVLVLRTDDKGLDSGIAQAKGKSMKLGRTLDATSGSANKLGASLTGAGRDAGNASTGFQRNVQAAIQLDAAQKRVGASAGQQRIGFMQLGQQLGDVSTMYALGARPMQIFASQSGQMFQAIQLLSGGTSKFASFMGGPWGIAIQIAVIALLPLIGNLLASGDAAEQSAEAMRRKAHEDMVARDALVIYGKTVEAHIEKERKLREEIEKQIQSQRQLNRERAGEAAKNLADLQTDLANTTKARTKAEEDLRAANERLLHPSRPEAAQGLAAVAAAAQQRVNDLMKEEAKLTADVARAQKTERMVQIPGLQADAEGRLDHNKAKINALTDAVDKLNDAFKMGSLGPAEYGRQYEVLAKQLEAARKASHETAKTLGETSRFIMPVKGTVTGSFGDARSARDGVKAHAHQGLDIAVPVGTPVKAPAAGTVIEAGVLPGYGNVVFIDHGGGTISRLAHLSRLDVVKGQSIGQGQTIGLSGGARGAPGSGDSTGPHVHFEVRVNGKAVNPSKGVFATDVMGAEAKGVEAAERAAAEAERARQTELRRKEQFDQASAQLDDRLLDLKGRGTMDQAALAQIDRDRVTLAEGRYTDDLAAQVASGELKKPEADYLAAKHKLITVVQLELIDAEERARKVKAGVEVELQLSDLRLELLRAQQGLARTNDQRRDLALAMLAEEEKQVRLEAVATIAAYKRGELDKKAADAAQRQLDQLDKLHPYRVEEIKRQNQGPLQDYLDKNDPAQTRGRVEGYMVDELEAVHKGITDAIADRLGVHDPFLRSLISLFIEQVLIRPIAQALQNAQGAGGSGGGGILGNLLSIGGALLGGGGGGGGDLGKYAKSAGSDVGTAIVKFAGGFDKGGLIPNGSYGVVHDGEHVFPTPGGARVVPSSDRRGGAGGAGGAPSIAFHNDFRGADAAAVAGIQNRLDRMQAELPGQIVSTMQDARARFVWR